MQKLHSISAQMAARLFQVIMVLGLVATAVVVTSPSASANVCSAEFDNCNGTGWHDGCHYGFASDCHYGGTWGDGEPGGGGGYGGWNYGRWVHKSRTGLTERHYTSSTSEYPLGFSSCNQGWQDGSWLDELVRSVVSGEIIRNLQFRSTCIRVPSQDWCTGWICYALAPYAWNTTRSARWEQWD